MVSELSLMRGHAFKPSLRNLHACFVICMFINPKKMICTRGRVWRAWYAYWIQILEFKLRNYSCFKIKCFCQWTLLRQFWSAYIPYKLHQDKCCQVVAVTANNSPSFDVRLTCFPFMVCIYNLLLSSFVIFYTKCYMYFVGLQLGWVG